MLLLRSLPGGDGCRRPVRGPALLIIVVLAVAANCSSPCCSSSRMARILSHVEPSSNVPRSLLIGGSDGPGEIPWCREVTSEATAGRSLNTARTNQSTGYRSPPSVLVCTVAEESPVDTAKAAAIDIIDAEAEELDALGLAIWNNPGLGYTEEEHFAVTAICRWRQLHNARIFTSLRNCFL